MEAVAEYIQEADAPGGEHFENDGVLMQESTRKFLTFKVGNEVFGLDILKVIEIIGIMEITKVPQSALFLEGVINLRGKVIPVIDLRTKFQLPKRPYDEETCIIVVDVGTLMGIIVDTVQEVDDIKADDIEPSPSLGDDGCADFIMGMGKVDDDVKMLLDIDQVLLSEELIVPC